MSKLKGIILQLQQEEYDEMMCEFTRTSADKFQTLFRLYRENTLRDDSIKEELKVNNSAYYTLKSRLLDKVQGFLSNRFSTPNVESIHKVEDIPDLIYGMSRYKAIAILKKLEVDIAVHDSPYKLASVYDALKKLHMHTQKYYEYTQLYNRHLAYTISIDKAGDLLNDFFCKLSDWDFTRNKDELQVMSMLQQELYYVCQLYDSQRLTVYRCLMDISYLLFLPIKKEIGEQDIEKMLTNMMTVFETVPHDKYYQHQRLAHHFLSFVYFEQNGSPRLAAEHYEAVNEKIDQFLLFNHSSYPSKFLMLKLERHINLGTENRLYDDNTKLLADYEPDRRDIANYVNFMIYRSVSAYYVKHYSEAAGILVRLMNEVSFKYGPRIESEIRLMMSLFYILAGEIDLVQTHLRSVSRKLREISKEEITDNFTFFYKLMSLMTNTAQRITTAKIELLVQQFDAANKTNPILKYIRSGEHLAFSLDMTRQKK